MKKLSLSKRVIVSIILVIATLTSIILGNTYFSTPKAYKKTISVIEAQKQDALALNVAITATASSLSMLPDDTASSVADELTNLSAPLFVIVSILYAEKFLLTTFGWISFTFLFPAAGILLLIHRTLNKPAMLSCAKKLCILSIALTQVIPVGAIITTQIEDTFTESVAQTYEAALDVTEDATNEDNGNFFTEFIDGVKNNVTGIIDMAKNVLSTMIDAVAVLLITSCAIPILTAFAFAWIVKMVLDSNAISNAFTETLIRIENHLLQIDKDADSE